MPRLSDNDYEDVYRESLLCLAQDGRDVGVPYRNGGGVRRCEVDGKALEDRAVIEAYWSEDIAHKILYAR